MEPAEYAEMVRNVDLAKSSLGSPVYELAETEMVGRKYRRSLFAGRDIREGEAFTEENVRCVRPAAGLSPIMYSQVLTHKASCDIPFGTPLKKEHLG